MPTAPDLTAVSTYLGSDHSWTDAEVTAALLAETAAQAKVCTFPPDPTDGDPLPYPADLAEALCRRVAHNLALRALPLGVQANITEMAVATTRVGGTDAEVRRLEAPHRRRVLG